MEIVDSETGDKLNNEEEGAPTYQDTYTEDPGTY